MRARAAADGAALLLFACVGLVSHRGGVSATGLARDALPLVACWFAVAAALGTYRRGGPWRLVATWAVAVPLAVLVRALALGHALDGGEAAFLAVSLAFTLLFVLALRLVLTRLDVRGQLHQHEQREQDRHEDAGVR